MRTEQTNDKNTKATSKFVIFINAVLILSAITLFASSYFINSFPFKTKILINLAGEGIIVIVFLTSGIRHWARKGEYFQGVLLMLGSLVITILGVFTFMNVFK